jgi:methylmalonyl-CoA/ethylmalonyl-CoA epimerase
MTPPILELRVAITAQDYQMLVDFYEEGFGIQPAHDWSTEQGRVVVYEMGRATLEIFDEPQAAYIDQIEAGQRLSGHIRLAIQVPDVDSAVKRLVSKGATLVHPPVITPWHDYNARLQSPDGLQITLFQPLGEET